MVDPVQKPNPVLIIPPGRQDGTGPAFSVPEVSDALIPSLTPSSFTAFQHLLGIQEGQSRFQQGGTSLPTSESGSREAFNTLGSHSSSGEIVVASDLNGFIGRSVGSGQCVALVRAANPDVGPTHCWSGGSPVQGNTNLKLGTVIATFDHSNKYANEVDGSSHAALYLGQNEQGIQVVDQWAGSSAAVRTIPWNTPGATAANTGSAFKVVQSNHA